jgi:hypothetical protein
MKGFKQIRRDRGGYIVDYYNDAGGDASFYAINVISAMVSPTGFIPGYYLTIALEFEQTESGLFKVTWMDEFESASQSELVTKFIDAAIKNDVETVYADREGKDGFFANVHNAGIKTYAPWRLMPAPSASDLLYGLSLVNQYITESAISSPETSIIYKQLENLGIKDQRNTADVKAALEDPALYAFHALRYILAGIERDIMPVAQPGNVYNLEAHKFYKPSIYSKDVTPRSESGFFV